MVTVKVRIVFQKSEVTGQLALLHSSPKIFVQRDQTIYRQVIV